MSGSARAEGSGASFTVLTVCTGNICRSPAAERLLRSALGPTVVVRSVGTHAVRGHPVSSPMDTLIESVGASAHGFEATQLDEGSARGADLVLGMTRSHRSAVVEVWPSAVRKAFTLTQFAGLLALLDRDALRAGTPADRLRMAVPLAAAQRGRLPSSAADDVDDPFRRGDRAYQAAFAEIKSAVGVIAGVVAIGDLRD